MVVQFVPLSSLVQPSFWHSLAERKIDVLKLSDNPVPVQATYSVGRSIRDRETNQLVSLGCTLTLGEGRGVEAQGTLINYNTIDDFKNADKAKLFNAHADSIWESILQGRTDLLNSFLLISFADLKKYKFYYWFAFPAFVAKPAWLIDNGWSSAADHFEADQLAAIQASIRQSPIPYFIVNGNTVEPIDKFTGTEVVAFVDPSPDPHNPGWPLRNLLAYLRVRHPKSTNSIRILCWRDLESTTDYKSRYGVLTLPPSDADPTVRPSAVGWEKNPQGKLGPRLADLAPMMDPTRLASQAVDLNLKLMRWRILPSLDLDKMASTRCLLLGAGTLGCYVARALMGWGVRTITFVDSGRVSFSNPVRQPLFEFEDCLEGGKPKAECAAAHLKKIYPDINATGYTIPIPMPGHPIPDTSIEQTKRHVAKIEKLIDEHDVVFLLMDSRESRWLPTAIGAAKNKIVINAALGFDTYLVMRHGSRSSSDRLGCYYCNDIVAPTDSLTDRTLDQMCTVTRPGLAPIAAATAVELLASLVQHPKGNDAPAPPATTNQDLGRIDHDDDGNGSVLGLVPHQLRGFLAQFRNLPLVGPAYEKCTGCSEIVLKEYEKEGFEMLLKAFNDDKYLERLAGLDKLFSEGEAVLESVDWDEEDDEF